MNKIFSNKKPVVGKFVLDSLSIGMYNHPLMVLREYIQNSVDSIDLLYKGRRANKHRAKIEIQIDGRNRIVTVKDSGGGIPAGTVWNAIYSLGESTKNKITDRGFRGIGRLGGLGYCECLKFITKAPNEKTC